eukprot:3640088-Amphidinium_carterae.1
MSWDDVEQRTAWSTVKAKPVFRRAVDDLVEVLLPHARVYTTRDHPFWSLSHNSIVSVHPEGTFEEYGMQTQPMAEGMELELENMLPVQIKAIVPAAVSNDSAVQAEIRASPSMRQLRGGDAEENAVEVMTLCLDPHHWFYVQGVRVHNKGCFAPWTPVLM